MALTKLPKNAFGTGSVDDSKIEDGTIQNVELEDGTLSSEKFTTGTIENASLSNSTITINGTSISLGGSSSVGVDVNWQSVITGAGSSSTAVAGNGYFIDTTSNTHTLNLPASATLGDQIAIKDYAGTFASNNLTIARNGHNIQGVANDSLISTNRASLVLVYVDSTKGWIYAEESNVASLLKAQFTEATGGTITTSGDFKIHTFTGDGCFVVSTLGNSPVNPLGGPSNVDYLVIAGGGAGGNNPGQGGTGGGGAGGHRTTFPSPGCNAGAFPISATTYSITVGAGGTDAGDGTPGSPSIFSTITSAGGGEGGYYGGGCASVGDSGGSGGGGGPIEAGGPGAGGAGNTPPVSPSQGNPGGTTTGDGGANSGSGGGGIGGSGSGAPGPSAGAGGNGTANSINGSSVTRAGGGGGGSRFGTAASGGSGGGGNGATGCGVDGGDGSTNTGSGGGGSGRGPAANGGAGGKGIVIIRYKFQ